VSLSYGPDEGYTLSPLSIAPISLTNGQILLRWYTLEVDNCTGTSNPAGWNYSGAPVQYFTSPYMLGWGHDVINVTGPTTFTVTCTGKSASDTKTIFYSPLAPALTFRVLHAPAGTYDTAWWYSANSSQCSIADDKGNVVWSTNSPATANDLVALGPILYTTTYALTCTNAHGVSTAYSTAVIP
jgi:hypothetical protein